MRRWYDCNLHRALDSWIMRNCAPVPYFTSPATTWLHDSLVVSVLDQQPLVVAWVAAKQPWVSRSLHPGPGLTQPSILSGSVNEYRLRLGRSKTGMPDAAWCAPCTWVLLQWQCLLRGAITNARTFTFRPTFTSGRLDETVLSRRRRRCEHNSQLAHDGCRRIRSTIWKLTKQTP